MTSRNYKPLKINTYFIPNTEVIFCCCFVFPAVDVEGIGVVAVVEIGRFRNEWFAAIPTDQRAYSSNRLQNNGDLNMNDFFTHD